MRFLRHKFVDPLTGKNDWRLLHAGPGGVILDSKVATNKSVIPNANASANSQTAGTATSGFGSNPNSFASGSNGLSNGSGFANSAENNQAGSGFGSFGNSGSGGSNSASTAQPAMSRIPTRPPAIFAANQSGAANGDLATAGPDSGQDPNATAGGLPGSATEDAANQLAIAQAMNGPGANGQPVAGPGGPNGAAAVPGTSDPQTLMRSLLNNQNPQTPQNQTAGSSSQTNSQNPSQNTSQNAVTGGGIAGVASTAVGQSIKVVNDQTRFSLWEFYYDMSKEANTAMASATNGMVGGAAGSTNSSLTNSNGVNQSGLGTSTSGFSLGSGFSNSSPPPASAAPPNQ